jgi:hypothetical protein
MTRHSSLEALVRRLRPARFGKICRSASEPAAPSPRSRWLGLGVKAAVIAAMATGAVGRHDTAAADKLKEWNDWEEDAPADGDSPRPFKKPASKKKTAEAPADETESHKKSEAKSIQQASAESDESDHKKRESKAIKQVQAETEVESDEELGSEFMGVIGRGGHLAMPIFGRNESISPIEFMPYLMNDEHFVFADVRGFVSNRAQLGGSLGGGYRYLDEPAHAWYGASLWYDIDDSTGYHFQDIGLSLEAMVDRWEFRSNFYVPVGNNSKVISAFNSDPRFAGNRLLFDRNWTTGTAMRGVDVEVGYSLPVDLGGTADYLRGFVGYYYFNGSNVEDISGVKVRAELDLSSTVTTQAQFTNDQVFGSQFMVGAQINLPWGNSHPGSKHRGAMPSPFRYVERNYNVIVNRETTVQTGVEAINPLTGLAYNVTHVDSTGAAGNGSLANPFSTVTAAQATGSDLIFVHADSVLNQQIVLAAGQQLIGESAGASVMTANYGSVLLPGSGAAGGATPLISGINGTAVTLNSGSGISGFKIDGITGDGIVGSGMNGGSVRNVQFSNISGDALRLTNATGHIHLESLAFDDIGGRGLVIDGGNAEVDVTATFDQITGDAVVVQNTTGGSVSFTDLEISNSAARGLYLNDLVGDLLVKNLTVTGSGGDAVYIDGGTGDATFDGVTTIDDPTGRGLVVKDSDSEVNIEDLNVTTTSNSDAVVFDGTTNDVTIEKLTIEADGGRGLVINNAEDVEVTDGSISTVGAAAVDVNESDIKLAFDSIDVDGGPVGIRILESTGQFYINGGTTLGGGGEIKNTVTGVQLVNSGTFAAQGLKLTDNATGVSSTKSKLLSLYYTQITGSDGYAIDSLNDELFSLSKSVVTGNGSIGGGSIRLLTNIFGTYQSQILDSTITDANGKAILYQSSGAAAGSSQSITIQGNTITGTRGNEALTKIDWDGPLNISFVGNTLNVGESGMIGLDILAASDSDELTLGVGSNTVTLADGGSTAFRTVASDTSNMQFSSNNIKMNGPNGKGFEFTLMDDADVWLHTNTITDAGGGGTGMLFNDVAADSRLQIENNVISFSTTNAIVERGIIFTTVHETIQLSGSGDNKITGATTDFSIPTGKSTGTIKVNGTNRP